MRSRKFYLDSLIHLKKDLADIRTELSSFDWDDEEEEIVLTAKAVSNVLSKAVIGDFTIEQLEEWADIIEVRNDIVYEELHDALIKEVISHLSNPDLFGKIDNLKLQNWIDKL